MDPAHSEPLATIYHGDCVAVMAELPEASVDAIVTDPPYGLEFMGKEWDAPWKADKFAAWEDKGFKALPSWGVSRNPTCQTCGHRARGRVKCQCAEPKWDQTQQETRTFQNDRLERWHYEWASAAFRVLKPGGHLLAFGGSRTYHRLACAIEDAGFEVRDCLMWLYGSGFPKSLDVSKAIDKARHDGTPARAVGLWLRERREDKGLKQKEVAALWPSATGGLTGCVANWELGFNVPKWDQWLTLKDRIGFGDEMDAEVWRLNGRKGTPGEAWQEAETLAVDHRMNEPSGIVNIGQGERQPVARAIKAPNSDGAREWSGWGTALKPAHEPIILARKPLAEKNVAANVLKLGTGALNVDGCRISPGVGVPGGGNGKGNYRYGDAGHYTSDRDKVEPHAAGRWPANVLLDEEAARLLDEQSGELTSGANPTRRGSSRFFYTAKADKDDRDGSKHPTVKPVELMKWLVTLVTPPGGVVLDPFLGSGTTVFAARALGIRSIGIEKEPQSVQDAIRRLRQGVLL